MSDDICQFVNLMQMCIIYFLFQCQIFLLTFSRILINSSLVDKAATIRAMIKLNNYLLTNIN